MADKTTKLIIEILSKGGAKVAADVNKILKDTERSAAQTDRVIEQSHKTRLNEQTKAQKRAADEFLRELGRVEAAEKKAAGGFSTLGASVASFLGNIAANAVSNLTSALISGAKAVLDYSSKLEQTKIGFNSLIQNGQKTEQLLTELKKLALDSPFEFAGLAPLAQRLLGANVELAKITPLLRDVGNVVSATGEASQERLEGITVALTQVINKQKLSAEEAEQFAERGVNAYDLIAKATGKTQAEIRKMGEQGGLSADLLVSSLQKVSREKFGDAMEKQSKTFAGAMSSIKDIVMQTAATAFEPLYKAISQITAKLAADLSKQTPGAKSIAQKFGESIGESIAAGIRNNFNAKTLGQIWLEALKFGYQFPGAVELGIGLGKGIIKGAQKPIVSNNPTPVSDPSLTIPGMNNQGNISIAPTPEMLEKQRKEREEALKKQLADLSKYNQLKIESERQFFEKIQKLNQDNLAEDGSNWADYEAQTLKNINIFQARVAKLMLEGSKIARQGKTGQELLNAQAEFVNDLNKFNAEIENQKRELLKRGNEIEKKAADEEIKIAEQTAERKIELDKATAETRLVQLKSDLERKITSEVGYASAVGEIQAKSLAFEKEILQESLQGLDEKGEKYAEVTQRIKILDEEITQQQIENMQAVEAAIEKATEARENYNEKIFEGGEKGEKGESDPTAAPGGTAGGTLGDLLGSIFGEENRAVITDGAEFMKSVFADLSQSVGSALGSIVDGLSNLLTQWIVTGKFSAKAALQMAAGVAAGLAVQAGIKAIYELAEGYAALGNPFLAWTAPFHFAAAKTYGIVAGISLAAGIGLGALSRAGGNNAQSAFNSQANQATGGNRSGSAGSVYSSYGDDASVLNIGRNAPSEPQQVQITFRERSGWFSEMFEIELKKNGKLRSLILDTA